MPSEPTGGIAATVLISKRRPDHGSTAWTVVRAGGSLRVEALVDLVEPRQVPDAVRRLAAELAAGPTLALGRGKRLLHLSTTESLETQMEHESQAIAQSGHTEDFAEGVRAFAEKRPPVFRGR